VSDDRKRQGPAGLGRRFARFLGQTTATQVVTAVVALGVVFVAGRLTADSASPPVSAQLAGLRDKAERHNESIVIRPGSLHGGVSYVVVTQKPFNGLDPEQSDEIAIYDLVGGKLKQMFRFRPAPDAGKHWQYRLDGIQDLESTGVQEVIGGFSQLIDSGGTRAFLPTVISWDDSSRSYVIQPLLPQSPLEEIALHAPPIGVGTEAWWRFEHEGVTLRDLRTGTAIHGYGGIDYVVTTASSFRSPSTTGLVIVGLIGSTGKRLGVEAVSAWILNPTLTHVTVGECPPQHSLVALTIGEIRQQLLKAFGTPGEC
jgi:hypothetical protein